jgi:hypothetical protein
MVDGFIIQIAFDCLERRRTFTAQEVACINDHDALSRSRYEGGRRSILPNSGRDADHAAVRVTDKSPQRPLQLASAPPDDVIAVLMQV